MLRCFRSNVRVGLNLMAVSPHTPRCTPSLLISATILSLLSAVSQSTAQNVPRPLTLARRPGCLVLRSPSPICSSCPTSVTRARRFSCTMVSRTAFNKTSLLGSPTQVLKILFNIQ